MQIRERVLNTANLADLREYRVLFGRHLFGDEGRFVFVEKYTLDPLKTQGDSALQCSDIEGIDSVRLWAIEYG